MAVSSAQKRVAYVVGAGPNGLTAAIELARAGMQTTLLEARPNIGGGLRSAALTLPGFIHDVCSAAHPMALSSPAMRTFPLADFGVEWIHPGAPLAHPFADGSAAILYRSVAQTAEQLGSDAKRYQGLFAPFAANWERLVHDILGPLRVPASPFLTARFGSLAVWPAAAVAKTLFRTREARALFAGSAAHSCLPLERMGSAAFGWVLNIAAHAVGWPVARGGSQSVANGLAAYFHSLGGKVMVNTAVASLDELPADATILLDVTPRQFLRIAGPRLPEGYRRRLERYRYGPGVFKMDWALNAPIPWRASSCSMAGTVHLGGDIDELSAAERAPWRGETSPRPFILLVQPSLFDPSRAPAGKHTAWAYCHVPNGSTVDMTETMEAEIERFAPGFRATILARSALNSADLESRNANLVGGDINGGAQDLNQLFLRPTPSLYRTPLEHVFLCSSSTPPGGGVHGMCGHFAALAALDRVR